MVVRKDNEMIDKMRFINELRQENEMKDERL
jgi:hypothetical protein